MITRSRIEEVSRLAGGKLDEVPYPLLLSALAAHRRTALLELHRPPVLKKVVVEGGVPVECRSNMLHETLGRFLVAQSVLTEEQLASCQQLAAQKGARLEDAVVAKRIVDSEELYRLLQQGLAKKLLDPFSFRDGEFKLVDDVPKVASPLRIHVPQLVLTGVCRFSPQELIDAGTGSLVGRRLGLVPEPLFPREELRLTPTQDRLLGSLQRRQRLDELAVGTGIGPDELTRLVYAFWVLGIVAPEDQLPAERRPVSPTAVPAPGGAPASTGPQAAAARPRSGPIPLGGVPRPPAEAGAEREALMQAYLSFRKKDAFDLLDLAETAQDAAVRKAYLVAAERWAPWRFDARDLAEKAEELFFAAARAFAELVDSSRREALLARRRAAADDPDERFSTTQRMRIQTDLLDPETQFKRAKAHLSAGKLREALALLEFVHTCDPQNGPYRAELARTRWLLSPATPGEPLRDLLEALRADPRCGLAALYAGEIYRAQGNAEQATLFVERAQKLLPGDARPAEELERLRRTRR